MTKKSSEHDRPYSIYKASGNYVLRRYSPNERHDFSRLGSLIKYVQDHKISLNDIKLGCVLIGEKKMIIDKLSTQQVNEFNPGQSKSIDEKLVDEKDDLNELFI